MVNFLLPGVERMYKSREENTKSFHLCNVNAGTRHEEKLKKSLKRRLFYCTQNFCLRFSEPNAHFRRLLKQIHTSGDTALVSELQGLAELLHRRDARYGRVTSKGKRTKGIKLSAKTHPGTNIH